MSEKVFITNSFKETQEVGEEFSKKLSGGEVLALHGDLGSGKTTFVQGIAKGLGIERRIISPTFIIMRRYKINFKYPISNFKFQMFYHIDLYRTQTIDDIKGLGIEEIIKDPQNVIAIEWPEKMGKLLPENRIDIYFRHISDIKREIKIKVKSQNSKVKTTTQN